MTGWGLPRLRRGSPAPASSIRLSFGRAREDVLHGGATHADEYLGQDQERAQGDEERADRPLDEDQEIAARDQHGAAEVLLEARSEHEAEQNRGGMEPELQQDIAEYPDRDRLADLEHVVVGRVDADADEEQRARVEVAIRDGEQLHPQPDHRHVEDDQHDVADPEARDQAPEHVRM